MLETGDGGVMPSGEDDRGVLGWGPVRRWRVSDGGKIVEKERKKERGKQEGKRKGAKSAVKP